LCHADGSKPGSGTKMMEQKELMRWISHNWGPFLTSPLGANFVP
jgi:hypothetical protein